MAQKKKQMATWKRVLVIGFLGMIFFAILMDAVETPKEDLPVLLLMLAVLALIIMWQVKKILSVKRKAVKHKAKKSKAEEDIERIQAEVQAKAAAERANEKQLKYYLRGGTYQGRQKWLEKIYYEEDRFVAPAIQLKFYEWEGKPACLVFACPNDDSEPVDIGNIPAERVEEVLALTDRMTDAYVKVYGGPTYKGEDKSYGAELTIIYK